ncbi:NADPH:quinone reductase and related Zn-dependent oxidoreductase [Amycolatopsis mediterranei S699]|uniref:NADPH:quinone reductase and related Zn-dependent oxidoreductase n=3 Tax=Amycolatopsis mediterranei TaxID=33910 RepID=A0A0H3DFG4_AMYMU|nr:NADP-dependent oxidoreductase [Amycolatopsis mediterranei]ADJ48379.1 NADPH:quinone reductase and related Zn-dependent oxidoreductase [Amycolatopsis mediterranei U32]AEK45300.1 NADPH:quinone reductase and related Zn-dependent oxidoreductase [Amycolatopsis mediterranei S699]AFO80090.1 NADPH:quinone reductase and related Zn-dependent oxidoreductase [Amycolatopsis mediterranei S699]AGT87218.1 NADPH:quinone reductase-related Zn-dependent oxidoreductase [Amycolatopsis mediterranei RB]KDO10898.1 N
MARAIRFDEYGDVQVLRVEDVPRPVPGPGQVLVEVRAAGINPGEASIRKGLLHERYPATFPSGQGSDFAGVVTSLGEGVEEIAVGDEVIGFVDTRSSHADFVVAEAANLTPRPDGVPWEVAGSLFVAGTTAYAAVGAVCPREGETVVVSGAAGGVGSLAVQLAKLAGATVIGLAGEANHDWLRELGVIPVAYGEGVLERIREAAPSGVHAFVDTFGSGYVELALHLGIHPGRINTIIDRAAAEKYNVKTDGNAAAASADVLRELGLLLDKGLLTLPIARVYPLDEVRDAYRDLEQRHTRGKIVLRP